MASTYYMPAKKVDQVLWSGTFVAVVGPKVSEYGLTSDLFSSFQALNSSLQTVWRASENETTRTKVVVDQRDQLLKQMKQQAGKLVSIIQGTPTVTSDMLIAAGLTVRKTTRTKPPVPAKPFVLVTGISGRNVTVEIRQDRNTRGKPARVSTATLMTATGPVCPMSMGDFTYVTATGRTTVTIPFPPSSTGDTVWITAFWTNTASSAGPAATPVSANLAAGGNLEADAVQTPVRMRAAA